MALEPRIGTRRRPVAGLQQQAVRTDTRQQQQDNGTHEFQPLFQQAGWHRDDAWNTLGACLQHGDCAAVDRTPLRRAALRLAK